jgi:hypothetical protein
VGFKNLDWPFLNLLFLNRPGRPDVDFSVLATTYDILPIVAKGSVDLAGRVFIATKFDLQITIPKIVQADPGIIAGDQDLHIAVRVAARNCDSVDPGNLAAFGVLSTSGPHVDL